MDDSTSFESVGHFSDSSRKQTFKDIFLIYPENVCCVYSLESSNEYTQHKWGGSNEYTQHKWGDFNEYTQHTIIL